MDMLIHRGERKAMARSCMALHILGVSGRHASPAASAGVVTDTNHSNAKNRGCCRPDRLRKALDGRRVPVVGGRRACPPTTT
jgi:aspartokinase